MSFKKFLKALKANWILAWLITAVFILVSIVCYAEYEEANTRMKRVFVASKQTTALFTSNYLMSTSYHKDVRFNEDDTKQIVVYLRNYNISDPNKLHEGGVSYTLAATLAHKSTAEYELPREGDEDAAASWAAEEWNTRHYSISISDGTNITTLSGDTISATVGAYTMSDSVRQVDTYTVTFNVPLDSDYCVTLEATPTDSAEKLTATIGVASDQDDDDNEGWTCTLADNQAVSIDNYDAFNYIITGNGGTSLKFSYDSTQLRISPVFLAYNNLREEEYSGRTGWKTVDIPVQSDINSYDIQMYKENGSSPSWSNLNPKDTTNRWVEFEVVTQAPAGGNE
ncbi:MAG: hypothetical protein Q4A05_00035 [Ruminococcus sp.]|nr:hypothetical protein [Ruminococcus sp.]